MASSEEIEDKFDEVINNEEFYVNGSESIRTKSYEDFVLETHSRVTALNFYTNQGK